MQEPWQLPDVRHALARKAERRHYFPCLGGDKPENWSSAQKEFKEKKETPSSFIKEQERCYLCLKYMLPSESTYVVLPCHEKCRSIFHLGCIVNKLWHYRGLDIICPICTEIPLSANEPRRKSLVGPPGNFHERYLDNRRLAEIEFEKKIAPLILKSAACVVSKFACSGDCVRWAISCVRNKVHERSAYIEETFADTGKLKGETGKKAGDTTMRGQAGDFLKRVMYHLRLEDLLGARISIEEIHAFLTNSFAGLSILGISLKDIKVLERKGQIENLSYLYGITAKRLRLSMGADLNVQNILMEGWSADTLASLSIGAHQLCILSMQKIQIPQFGFTLEEWVHKLGLSKILVQVLRIQREDFMPPKGMMHKAGWTLKEMIRLLQLSEKECKSMRLDSVYVPDGTTYADMAALRQGARGKVVVGVNPSRHAGTRKKWKRGT